MTSTDRPIVAEAPGVRITASARGAHLMSWTTHGVDRLWMSPLSRPGQAQALRGGVPVLFPQFGTFGDLPKHGFARTADWDPVRAPLEHGRATLAFQLTDSEETRAVWPHPFRARLAITASPIDLTMTLIVENRGQDVARFTGGLHTYLAVADPEAWIFGARGVSCVGRCLDLVTALLGAPRGAHPCPRRPGPGDQRCAGPRGAQ